MYQQDDDGPKVGGAFAAAFLLLALVCLGAFGAVAGGAFKPLPVARLLVAPGKVERALGRDIGRKDKAVDQRLPAMTASIGAAPICNFEACGRAFLSFRPSDFSLTTAPAGFAGSRICRMPSAEPTAFSGVQ
jgi:hypothetical protein